MRIECRSRFMLWLILLQLRPQICGSPELGHHQVKDLFEKALWDWLVAHLRTLVVFGIGPALISM